MMSKYATGREYNYVAENTPRGRRYQLENPEALLSSRSNNLSEPIKSHQTSPPREYNVRQSFRDDEYFDLREAKSVNSKQSNAASVNSGISQKHQGLNTNHVGTANAIQPTGNVIYRGRAKKTPRQPISNISPRKPLYSDSNSPSPEMVKRNQTKASSPRKDGRRKGDNTTKAKDKGNAKGRGEKTEKGALSARDQYMVGLYDSDIKYLKPSQVRYTHDEITSHFQDGKPLLATFKALLYGHVQIRCGEHDVPPIEVMQSDDLWFVVNGNRRLYVFKRLQKCGALSEMQVVVRKYDALVMDAHFSTRTMGRTILLVNDGHLEDKMSDQVSQWKEWKLRKDKEKPQQKGKPKQQAPKNPPPKSSGCCTIS